ncbi:MAG TPA: exodeoxyribonuclease VII large subunit [Gemmatimonadales bacterium]|jgi:exodeoxyribonuclease VII large subunit|nr:exodeoxyribonuclease VII large subunit [Gemmatimonadales bacterium]
MTVGLSSDVLSVSQFAGAVKQLLEGTIGPVWIRGEVTGFKVWSSGHWYFTLRDANAQLRCCMWRTYAQRAGRPPADGTSVYALGVPTFYDGKGEFQLSVRRLLPTSAIGEEQRRLDRVKAALAADGLFEVARKRSLPRCPERVAVVTSTDGAALRDIVTVTRKRWPSATLLVVDSRVQGEGAARELVAALRLVNRLDVELCIVGRGGGAQGDLAAFNDEAVCRALAAVRVPTVSAVGHETDVSLTDLVADVRAATPSAAAELAFADAADVRRQAHQLGGRLARSLGRRAELLEERLARAGDRVEAAMDQRLSAIAHRGERLGAELDALSPLRVLQRGYAVPLALSGQVLRRRSDFPPGVAFRLRVVDGVVPARANDQ